MGIVEILQMAFTTDSKNQSGIFEVGAKHSHLHPPKKKNIWAYFVSQEDFKFGQEVNHRLNILSSSLTYLQRLDTLPK